MAPSSDSSTASHYDVIVVGGGIVGVSTAMNILEQRPSLRVLVLEKETAIGLHQTGNNSGVIHSGIYYKPGSLKAHNCISGYKKLIEFCDRHNVAYELCGKVIVAVNERQLPQLDELYRRGVANGLQGLRFLDRSQLKEMEPHAEGIRAIHVPQTGIIDYTDVIHAYARQVETLGGTILCGQEVAEIRSGNGAVTVVTGTETYRAKALVTCAGLHADRIARMTNPSVDFRIIPFRGEYYTLTPAKQHLVKTLIYPVPDPAFPFLGVHFTRLIHGGVEAGPNAVLAFKREGYTKTAFNARDLGETLAWPGFRTIARKYWRTGFGEFKRSFSKQAFVTALQALMPEIASDDLQPGGAGVRAQACSRNGGLIDDFLFVEQPGIVHVCNAPSPAATSSLSIGEHIAGKIVAYLN
ncbi:MAG: L-2-hydroxyglutarate oxidase [Bacteroidetes bacterium]|nr:L-2-hydroxyglutarate oxidase [Bacteroidota bacterium]